MKLLATAEQGRPIEKLRFHPRRRLLASVASPRAGVCVWTWDDSGAMECVARIDRGAESQLASGENAPRLRDVAWHPQDDLLAIVGSGRPIELWGQGRLVKTIGKRPVPGRVREIPSGIFRPGQAVEPRTFTLDIPLADQGYGAVAFSADGERLVASLRGEDPDGNDPTEVYDLATEALVDSFWRSDTTLALHPEGEILATLCSDQSATAIRFGRLTGIFQTYNVELNAFGDGYVRLLFSPAGDAFAIVGHAYCFGVKVYRFPSCQVLCEADCEDWEDVWRAFWRRHQSKEPARTGSAPEDPPYEFISTLPSICDRIAFSPDGLRLLVGSTRGAVIEINVSTGEPVCTQDAHDSPVTALDASATFPLLASADADGRIKLWGLDAPRATLDLAGKPMTRAFLESYQPIDPTEPGGQFRTTDGKRWYDLERIGEDDLDADAPPWAQIAKMTSLWGLDHESLNERAQDDLWARHVQSIKEAAERPRDADRSGERRDDRASD